MRLPTLLMLALELEDLCLMVEVSSKTKELLVSLFHLMKYKTDINEDKLNELKNEIKNKRAYGHPAIVFGLLMYEFGVPLKEAMVLLAKHNGNE